MRILVTGSAGLIGSEVSEYFLKKGHQIYGLDNNSREVFFGPNGSTLWNKKRLLENYKSYQHGDLDIRDKEKVLNLLDEIKPEAIVHTAAQPSHDKAASIPFEDFHTNAVGTLNLLEGARRFSQDTTFVHLSTNKVYGDRPNKLEIEENDKRFDYDKNSEFFEKGINENFSIDQSTHSLFGASKVASDILVQEYGRYFGMKTCCLRGGCLTGPSHSGVELHGFLSYLIKCYLTNAKYTVFGYKGKQVRDNIHSIDVVRFIDQFIEAPRIAQVYNLGGGFNNSISIIESFDLLERIIPRNYKYGYDPQNRVGDHIVYYSDLSLMKKHYPNWGISRTLENIFEEIIEAWQERLA
tara:strand:- start:16870 stop:17925 length:1056 start_codon:yes stop_codon:yes gene_type:complete